MAVGEAVEFPNLGVVFDALPRGFSLFWGRELSFYGIFIGLGILTAFLAMLWQAGRTGLEREACLDFAVFAIPLALIGGKFYGIAFSWEQFQEEPGRILTSGAEGLPVYGVLLSVLLCMFVYAKVRRVSLYQLADTCCVGLLAGQAVAAWGDFFGRSGFGGYTDGPFAMRLHLEDVDTAFVTEEMYRMAEAGGYYGSVQVQPVFLYESMWAVGMLAILLLATRRKKQDGELIFFYLVACGLWRAWVDGLGMGVLRLWGTQFPVSWLVSAVLVLGGVAGLASCCRQRHKQPARAGAGRSHHRKQ